MALRLPRTPAVQRSGQEIADTFHCNDQDWTGNRYSCSERTLRRNKDFDCQRLRTLVSHSQEQKIEFRRKEARPCYFHRVYACRLLYLGPSLIAPSPARIDSFASFVVKNVVALAYSRTPIFSSRIAPVNLAKPGLLIDRFPVLPEKSPAFQNFISAIRKDGGIEDF
jgi:hypothetical protein